MKRAPSRSFWSAASDAIWWALYRTFFQDRFRPRAGKRASDGTDVVLSQDALGGWCVGSPAADPAVNPIPLGAFASQKAAANYADHRFPGGAWTPLPAR